MNRNEQIDQLLSQFMDPQNAERAADDIRTGDALFAQYPAPDVRREALGQIRSRLVRHSRMQRRHGALRFAGSAAAAAVIVFALLHGVQQQPADTGVQRADTQVAAVVSPVETKETIVRDLWKRLVSHESLVQIDRELTDLADSIDAVQSETYGELVNTMKIDMLELEELEMITANTDFWKG